MAHAILLYNPAYDDTYFVTQFILGLRKDIRAAIVLHRPQDVVTAVPLALLQEEELSHLKQKPHAHDVARFAPKQDKPKSAIQCSEADDKLSVLKELKEYRRKNGLCYRRSCALTWCSARTGWRSVAPCGSIGYRRSCALQGRETDHLTRTETSCH